MGLTAVLLLLLGAPPCEALEAYSPSAFASWADKDRVIVLQFRSPSCSVCPRQELSLERLAQEEPKPVPVFLQAHYDREEDLRRKYKVEGASALLVFRGQRYLGSSIRLYTEEDIRSFLHQILLQDRGKPKQRPKRRPGPRR